MGLGIHVVGAEISTRVGVEPAASPRNFCFFWAPRRWRRLGRGPHQAPNC